MLSSAKRGEAASSVLRSLWKVRERIVELERSKQQGEAVHLTALCNALHRNYDASQIKQNYQTHSKRKSCYQLLLISNELDPDYFLLYFFLIVKVCHQDFLKYVCGIPLMIGGFRYLNC